MAHDCLNFPSPPFFFMSKQNLHLLQFSREHPSHWWQRTRRITVFSFSLCANFFGDLRIRFSDIGFSTSLVSVFWTRTLRALFLIGDSVASLDDFLEETDSGDEFCFVVLVVVGLIGEVFGDGDVLVVKSNTSSLLFVDADVVLFVDFCGCKI